MAIEDIEFYQEEITNEKYETYKQNLKIAAFPVWLTNKTGKSFDEFCSSLGIGDKKMALNKEERQELLKRVQVKSAKIIAMDKGK